MYARNIATFAKHLLQGGKLTVNVDDEITRETLVTHGGEIVHVLEKNGAAHNFSKATAGGFQNFREVAQDTFGLCGNVSSNNLLSRRIDLLLALPIEKLERLALEAQVRAIGHQP